MQGAALLEVKLSEKILLTQRVHRAGDKESPLLNRGLNLSEVDLSGKHYISSTIVISLQSFLKYFF